MKREIFESLWASAGHSISVDVARAALGRAISQLHSGEITRDEYSAIKASIDRSVEAPPKSAAERFVEKLEMIKPSASAVDGLTPKQFDKLWRLL